MSDIERLGIGSVITGKQFRDAIHIPIAPITAGMDLNPGDSIIVANSGIAMLATDDQYAVGVIDPFLKNTVIKGQTVWLFLNPGSVISLRHDWVHSAFVTDDMREESKQWLINFCNTHDCPSYDTVMNGIQGKFYLDDEDTKYYANGGYINDDYLHFNSVDAHSSIPDEFWEHVEVVLGKRPKYRPKYFSCSC